jgi:hypothetical protein
MPANARFIFALDEVEDRANPAVWRDGIAASPERCVAILSSDESSLTYRLGSQEMKVGLTDHASLSLITGTADVFIDVSGLPHSVWAPLLKTALLEANSVRLMYFEPSSYRHHASPSSASLFDLSASFLGVQPLPGFANLVGPSDESDALFVPFLGFEGSRARQVSMTLDPIPKVIPVVGLPGFKLQYPQLALSCNQEFLEENGAEPMLRYAAANCPFEAYTVLDEIRRDHPRAYLYLAPIGTKPHAIGAVLYALDNPKDTEIMFDHPVKSQGRSSGVGMIHIYTVKG